MAAYLVSYSKAILSLLLSTGELCKELFGEAVAPESG